MISWLQITPEPKENKLTQSGLLLILAQAEIVRGTVVTVSDEEKELKEGDEIFFGKDMVEKAEVDGVEVHLLKKASVFCKIENNELIPVNNIVLLDIDTSTVRSEAAKSQFILDAQGEPIKTEYFEEAFDCAPKRSRVVAVPSVITGGNGLHDFLNNVKVEKGDYVYHHHLASNARFRIEFNGQTMYWQEYNQVFAVEKEDTVIPLERYLFIAPIPESEDTIKTKSGIFTKTEAGVVLSTGILKYVSPYAKSLGFKEGATVKFYDRARYEIMVKGELLYKSRLDNIYAADVECVEVVNLKRV